MAQGKWMIVGAHSTNTLIVRDGDNPIAIRVNHGDAADLVALINDANMGRATSEDLSSLNAELDRAIKEGRMTAKAAERVLIARINKLRNAA